MVPSENLRALSSFCLPTAFLCSGNSCAQVPDTVKANYSAAFCPCLHWCNCKEILNLHQNAWAQNGSARKYQRSHTECLAENPRKRTPPSKSVFSSTFFLKLVWDYAHLLPRKSLPLQSIIHVSKGMQDSNFIQLYGGFQRKCCCYGVFSALYSVSRTPVFSVFRYVKRGFVLNSSAFTSQTFIIAWLFYLHPWADYGIKEQYEFYSKVCFCCL